MAAVPAWDVVPTWELNQESPERGSLIPRFLSYSSSRARENSEGAFHSGGRVGRTLEKNELATEAVRRHSNKVKKSAPSSTSWWLSFFRIFSLNPQKNYLSCKSYISGKESPSHWWWFTSVRKLMFHGHILRVDNDEAANIFALYEPFHGRKPRGRPRNSVSSKVGEWIDPE